MKLMKLMPLALVMLLIAVLVSSPALMEGAFFTVYGQFIAVAAGFAAMLLHSTRKQTLRLGAEDEKLEAIDKVKTPVLAFCCTAAALVGARLLYCIVRYDFYLFDVGLAGMLRIWEGGFMLYGAAAGAMIAACALVSVPAISSICSRMVPVVCTERNTRVCSVPSWPTTAPWNFSEEPRLLRHWKY